MIPSLCTNLLIATTQICPLISGGSHFAAGSHRIGESRGCIYGVDSAIPQTIQYLVRSLDIHQGSCSNILTKSSGSSTRSFTSSRTVSAVDLSRMVRILVELRCSVECGGPGTNLISRSISSRGRQTMICRALQSASWKIRFSARETIFLALGVCQQIVTNGRHFVYLG